MVSESGGEVESLTSDDPCFTSTPEASTESTAEDSDATPASSEIDSESESLNLDKESSSFAVEALEEETEVNKQEPHASASSVSTHIGIADHSEEPIDASCRHLPCPEQQYMEVIKSSDLTSNSLEGYDTKLAVAHDECGTRTGHIPKLESTSGSKVEELQLNLVEHTEQQVSSEMSTTNGGVVGRTGGKDGRSIADKQRAISQIDLIASSEADSRTAEGQMPEEVVPTSQAHAGVSISPQLPENSPPRTALFRGRRNVRKRTSSDVSNIAESDLTNVEYRLKRVR
jgi:hypothetical protein